MADREREGRTGQDSGNGVKEQVKDAAREVKDQASEKAGDVAAEAREQGREMVREGKDRARSQAERQKDRVSEGLRSVAGALRRGSRDLEESEQPYGRFLETVADQAEGASRYLEDRDVDSLTREVRGFARDHTPVFLGGAFTLGMLGARFLKSSTPEGAGDETRPRGYGELQRSRGYGEPHRARGIAAEPQRSSLDDLDRMGMSASQGVGEERFVEPDSGESSVEEGGYA